MTSNKIIRLTRTDDPTIAKDLKNGDMILACMIHKPTRRKHILIFSKERWGVLGVPIYYTKKSFKNGKKSFSQLEKQGALILGWVRIDV